jgi:hypothetical protein
MSSPITETEAAAFNPDILHQLVLKYRMPKLIARNIMDTRFESVKIGDNIDVAPLTRITVGTISLGTGFKSTTYQNPTETKVTIAINTWVYGAFALELYEEAVAAKDLEALYRQSALDTVLVKIDLDALADADNYGNTVGSDNVSVTDDNVLTAVDKLDTGNVPEGDRNMVFYPSQLAEFFKLDKWVNSLYRGHTPVNQYNIGEMYGARVWKTTQVKAGSAGHVNFLSHKEASALVVRKQPSAWVLDDPDTQARKVVYPAIYGIKEMRDDHGHELLGL